MGAGLSKQLIGEPFKAGPDVKEICTFCVPCDFAASKNRIYRIGKFGNMYKTREGKKLEGDITLLAQHAMRGNMLPKGKRIWLDIHVERKDMKADPINLLDLLADGLKKALGVDDRYFAVWRLDWSLVEFDPQVFISIGL